MKKIISLLLAIVLTMSLFTGCNKQEQPKDPSMTEHINTEPTVIHEEPSTIFVTGVFYRTENKQAVLISPEYGTFILQNTMEEFAQYSDFSVVAFEADSIPEEKPASILAQNLTLISQTAKEDEMSAVDDLLSNMISMGYEPASIGTIIGGEDGYIYITPYDVITTIVDALATNENNTMFSPLSLNFALGMAANGANDEIKTKFENYFGMDIENYNKYVQNYSLNASPWFGETVVDIANSIWLCQPLTLQDQYAELMNIYYNAEVQSRTFDDAFIEEVNKWCANKTHDMIPTVLDAPPMSKALLINALYFQGEWDVGYEDYQIKEWDFTTTDGDVITVEAMQNTEETFYMENEHATAFAKYYKDLRYAFVGILPKEEGDFTLASLDLESLMDAEKMEFTTVNSMIPKFKFNNAHDMLKPMERIGLPMEEMALDNITDSSLFITDVRQYTAVEVNEEGSRAAAVTVVETDGAAMIPDEELPKQVLLNRPFAFMIYDMENQTPLFVGKVVNPNR